MRPRLLAACVFVLLAQCGMGHGDDSDGTGAPPSTSGLDGSERDHWRRRDVFGQAFWAGTVYGFDAAGELFAVSLADGQLKTMAIAIPLAGSTTSAPLSVH